MKYNDYFSSKTVGQENLKKEIWHCYEGAVVSGLPVPHGLLIGKPGTGKTAQFTPAIAKMINARIVGPFSISKNMKLDDLVDHITLIIDDGAGGEDEPNKQIPLVVLEELSNVGKPNSGRLLTLLTEGRYTTLTGEVWTPGVPGVDWAVLADTNDDGYMLPALKSRFEYLRVEGYSLDELVQIGANFAFDRAAEEVPYDDLVILARDCESPREMIARVRRLISCASLGEESTGEAVLASLRLDADGLHIDAQRVMVALKLMGGESRVGLIAGKLRTRPETVSGWIGLCVEKGFIDSKSGRGGGTKLTLKGKKKASELAKKITL